MSRGNTADRILDVAERLIAERGVEAVSLREVGQLAGQRNNSAAQYHFGSKDGLMAAVIDGRSRPVELDRARMIEALGDTEPSVRQLLEVFVLPLAATLHEPSWYLRFLFQVIIAPSSGSEQKFPILGGMRFVHRGLRRNMPDLDPARFRRRYTWLAQIVFQVLAEQERAAERDPLVLAQVTEDLLTMLEALVTAPA